MNSPSAPAISTTAESATSRHVRVWSAQVVSPDSCLGKRQLDHHLSAFDLVLVHLDESALLVSLRCETHEAELPRRAVQVAVDLRSATGSVFRTENLKHRVMLID